MQLLDLIAVVLRLLDKLMLVVLVYIKGKNVAALLDITNKLYKLI